MNHSPPTVLFPPDRALRLWLLACCRRLLRPQEDTVLYQAMDSVRNFADGLTHQDTWPLNVAAMFINRHLRNRKPQSRLAEAISYLVGNWIEVEGVERTCYSLAEEAQQRAQTTSEMVRTATTDTTDTTDTLDKQVWYEERAQQKALRSCILGPSTRGLVPFPWLRSLEHPILLLARSIDEEARYTEMPILGDALEEVGCTDPFLLAHCRRHLAHDHGCWVLERIFEAARILGV